MNFNLMLLVIGATLTVYLAAVFGIVLISLSAFLFSLANFVESHRAVTLDKFVSEKLRQENEALRQSVYTLRSALEYVKSGIIDQKLLIYIERELDETKS